MGVKGSKCDRCGEFVSDLDAGFSPSTHGMKHGGDCGGTWVEFIQEPIALFIWSEHTVLKGHAVGDDDLERYDDPNECDDWHDESGMPDDMLASADRLIEYARPGGGGQYDRQCAITILKAIGWSPEDIEKKVYA